jgi:endonuclease/exonuclease/phosphatase family metal-dependent hydrolase
MFSVMTLNLRFGLADDGKNSWRFRKGCIPVLFEKCSPDFVAFQEVNDFQIEFLDNVLKAYEFVGKRSPAPYFWQNNIIFYKPPWRCTYRQHFYLSHTPETPSRFRDSLWPRQCTVGMFEKNNRRLVCVNTHFDFDVSVQVQSAKLILSQLTKFPADIPVILMGDFNASPASPSYKIFTGIDRTPSATNAGLFKNAFSEPYPGTTHGFTGDPNRGHIDWILYCGPIINKESNIMQKKINGIYPSDHFPLYGIFAWAT